ncbi:hypothetical protein C1H46_028226 [Malus baccata]|uniref:RRM domain-containing protein n=1 Tax=Malus baccata TaxID=106549 RepID=A0A540LIP9_MALBA|nr:hypothetical protein C1H46_028226 [Malus baccata]
MSEELEYRCFIGGLAWSTSDRSLREAFEKFGKLVEAKVVVDKFSGRSRGFGFVTFDDKKAMEEAIEEMNGLDLDGRTITVDKAQPHQGGGEEGVEGMVVGMIGMIGMVAAAVVVVVMDLIEMETDHLVGAAGILVVVEVLEVIDTVVIALGHMNVGVQEASDQDRIIASDSALEPEELLG